MMDELYFSLEYEISDEIPLECAEEDVEVTLEHENINIVTAVDHAVLINRDNVDSHPVEAITGLREELDSKLTNNIPSSAPGNILVVGTFGQVQSDTLCCTDIATKEEVAAIVQDKHYTHIQSIVSNLWTVNHNLNKRPSVSIADSAGNIVQGEIKYIDMNTLSVSFSGAFSGRCYCN